MLDVHPPHVAAHSWKDFFIHIATIVIGLLIAIGLEQMVEFSHHRHQVEQIDEALQNESIENRDIGRADVGGLRLLIENLRLNREGLRSAAATDGIISYTWQETPTPVFWLPLVDSAWLTARDSAIFSLLPPQLVTNRWRVEFTMQQSNTLGGEYFESIYAMRSQIHQNGADIRLTPQERLDALTQLVKLDAQLRNLYSTMMYFESANDLYLHHEPITIDNLRKYRAKEDKPPSW